MTESSQDTPLPGLQFREAAKPAADSQFRSGEAAPLQFCEAAAPAVVELNDSDAASAPPLAFREATGAAAGVAENPTSAAGAAGEVGKRAREDGSEGKEGEVVLKRPRVAEEEKGGGVEVIVKEAVSAAMEEGEEDEEEEVGGVEDVVMPDAEGDGEGEGESAGMGGGGQDGGGVAGGSARADVGGAEGVAEKGDDEPTVRAEGEARGSEASGASRAVDQVKDDANQKSVNATDSQHAVDAEDGKAKVAAGVEPNAKESSPLSNEPSKNNLETPAAPVKPDSKAAGAEDVAKPSDSVNIKAKDLVENGGKTDAAVVAAKVEVTNDAVDYGDAESGEDDELDLVAMSKFEYEQVANLTPSQLRRYEQYRRSDLKNGKVKKTLVSINPLLAKASEQYIIAVKGLAKLFVGDTVETAVSVRRQLGDRGPLQPKHIREAYRRLRKTGAIPSTTDKSASLC